MGVSSPEVNRRGVRAVAQRKKAVIWAYKASIGCPCGETDPVVLDLHHRDPATKHPRLKRAGHGQSWQNRLSYPEIAAELEKCDVLCANCHRRTTYGGDQIAA